MRPRRADRIEISRWYDIVRLSLYDRFGRYNGGQTSFGSVVKITCRFHGIILGDDFGSYTHVPSIDYTTADRRQIYGTVARAMMTTTLVGVEVARVRTVDLTTIGTELHGIVKTRVKTIRALGNRPPGLLPSSAEEGWWRGE